MSKKPASKLDFASDIERFLAMFPGLAAYADEVGKVGTLEQAATEAQSRIDKAKKDFDEQVAQLEKQRAEYLNEVEKAGQAATEATAEAEKIVVKAHEKADAIVAKSKTAADAMIMSVTSTVQASQNALAEANAKIAEAKQELEGVRVAHDNAKAALAELTAKKKQVQDSLDELKARL